MRRLATPLLLLALVSLGCATVRVKSDFDEAFAFYALRTFAWLEPPLREQEMSEAGEPGDPFERNTLLDKRVRAAVDGALAERGYRKAERDEADFLLRYHVVLRERTVTQPGVFYGGIRRPPFSYSGYYGTYSYEEGTLILDVIDPATEQIVWRGWGQARTGDGYLDAERIRRYVGEILKRFPPDPDDAPAA